MKSKQHLFEEMNEHLLLDVKPSDYFNGIKDGIFFSEFPFTLLSKLKDVPQSPRHHPEGSVWNHTMLVIDEAARVKCQSSDAKIFMWAALLHDVGKAETTRNKKGKITAYDHEKLGAQQSKQFLQEFTGHNAFIQSVSSLIRWHMQILFVIKSMQFADIPTMNSEVDIHEVALLGYCDRLGRLNADQPKEEENIRIFVEKCKSFNEKIKTVTNCE